MKEPNTRALSATILGKVLSQQGSLSSQLGNYHAHKDYPLLQEICFGVCRHYYAIRSCVTALLEKPLRTKDLDIECLLMIGIYQLQYLRVPDHAAVNETVNATKGLKKPWAKGLVNAVLRKAIRLENLSNFPKPKDEESYYSHPAWLISMFKADWPDHWEVILENNNSRAPMTLRVNLSKIQRTTYLKKLEDVSIDAYAGTLTNSAIYLTQPCPIENLPDFVAGEVSIQDEASQLVPSLLNLEAGLSILDACAAPGGKTAHILECEQSLSRLVAVDNKANRLATVTENLDRLGLHADLVLADASKPENWWDELLFDRILLDAPCSATGVIRRHPDIKLLRRENEFRDFSDQQQALLIATWRLLKPGGLLLYTTCSVLRLENDVTVGRFLETHPEAKFHAIEADWGVECQYGRQMLPVKTECDGFYYSLLEKS